MPESAESTAERLRELYPARVGTTLIRLRARDKKPIDSGWNVQAVENFTDQIDPTPIYETLARHIDNGGNIGWAIPPGVLVLDADDERSAVWLREALPDAPCQATSKGCHVVVQAPRGLDLSQRARVSLFDGVCVDLRTSGSGQIAVEPSVHPSGTQYVWERELPLDLSELPELPGAILASLRAATVDRDSVTSITDATWRHGTQHTRLVSMAGRLRNSGLSVEEIEAALQVANQTRCEKPGSRHEIAQIARSAGKWEQGPDPGGSESPIERDGLKLADISFSGDSFMALLDEPKPDPVYPGIPPAGHFSLVVAPSFSGKTSLVLWVAMARVHGASPWLGAPSRNPGRVLFYSIDEPPSQVAWRVRSLAKHHPCGVSMAGYAARMVITGPHRTINPDALEALRFTDLGLRTLDGFLHAAKHEGDPFTDVIVDAYSDLLPLGESDTSNEEATRIGGALERMAVFHGCSITVIHHAGKPKHGESVPDPRDMGRGASALAAKARAIFTVEEEAGMSNLRKIRTRTNLTPSPPPLVLECAERSTDEMRVDFFRPHDPAVAFPIDSFLNHEDDWISTRELARRISRCTDESTEDPTGSAKREAKQVRQIWLNAGLIEVRKGARNADEMRRI